MVQSKIGQDDLQKLARAERILRNAPGRHRLANKEALDAY
jgi:hypothetical protein